MNISGLAGGAHPRRSTSKNGMSAPIMVALGLKQGDPLSAILFNCVMEWVLSELEENVGVSIRPDIRVNHLAFSDDITLIAQSVVGLNRRVTNFKEGMSKAGLKLNPRKSGRW